LPIYDCQLDYWRNCISGDAVLFAVIRLQPYRKLLLSFTRIAPTTTKSDVLSCDNCGIVDYMFPAGGGLFRNFGSSKLDATVDARLISVLDFFF
jgi:hypothetical protein